MNLESEWPEMNFYQWTAFAYLYIGLGLNVRLRLLYMTE